MKGIILTILFAILFFPVFSHPGNPAMDKLAARLDSLKKNNPQELVYLQTSKDIYETGEDLWFKAYVLNSQNFIGSHDIVVGNDIKLNLCSNQIKIQ
ncbi:MAG: hypothetical protein Q7J86_15205 [Bacteroidota bacterium]|nr:hypothetical protein [Bacteroidota bacterium]